jgi:DNA uptake protein ComE-like DNA-binding protein
MNNRRTEGRKIRIWRGWGLAAGVLAGMGIGIVVPDSVSSAQDAVPGKVAVSLALPGAVKTVAAKSVDETAARTVKPKTVSSETRSSKGGKGGSKAPVVAPAKESAAPASVPQQAEVARTPVSPAPTPVQAPKVYPITSVFVKEELPEEKTLPPPPPPAPLDLGVAPEAQLFPEWARSATSATQVASPAGSLADAGASTQTAVVKKVAEPAPVAPPEPQTPPATPSAQEALLPDGGGTPQVVKPVPTPVPVPTPIPPETGALPVSPETMGGLVVTPTPAAPVQVASAAAPGGTAASKLKPTPAGATKPPAGKNGAKGAAVKPHPLPTPTARSMSPTAPTKEKPLDLNTATRVQLMELPGVDGIRADLILAHRRAIGSFRVTTQLREVYGISDSIWEQVADLVTVAPGAPARPTAGASRLPVDKVFRPALPQSPVRPKLPTPPAPPVPPAGTPRPDLSTLPSAPLPAGK